MRLRTAHDRLKIEHSIIDGVRDMLRRLLDENPSAIRSVVPGVIRPVRDARGKVKVRVTVPTQNGWKAIPFSPAAIELLRDYDWPGNIRELRNVVERLLLLAETGVDSEAVQSALPALHLTPRGARRDLDISETIGPLAQRVLAFEREAVIAELERHGRHITQTARALGLERSHLYKKCQQLGIDLQNLPARE